MVAVVAGNGLGLFNSSLNTLGSNGIHGDANHGILGGGATSASSSLYVNTATGNLIVQSLDEQLAASGLDSQFIRTYNSLGQLNDRNGDNWRHNGERNLVITGELNTEGSTISRIAADGSYTTYQYNSATNTYQSTDGGAAHDEIRLSVRKGEQVLRWTEGSSHLSEYYHLTSGRLLAQEDSKGNAIEFSYDSSNRLSLIEDIHSNQRIHLQYDSSNRLTSIATSNASNNTPLRQVYYAYDSQNRLSSVTVDLTPDGSASDNNSIRTVYSYVNSSSRLVSGISRYEDGSTAIHVASIEYDAQNRVRQVQDQNGTTVFSYDEDTSRTTVANLGNTDDSVRRYQYDGEDRLIRSEVAVETGVLEYQDFDYNDNGDLVQITDGNTTVRYYYDSNGNRVREVDSGGNYVSRIFSSDNLLLSETTYTQSSASAMPAAQSTADTLPGLPSDLGQALTTTYVYSDKRELRFVITPERRVTEYQYNDYGQRIRTIQYADLMDTSVPPYVADPLQNQRIDPTGAFSFSIPASTFVDLTGDALTLSARLGDGAALPSWISFDAATGTFSGTSPIAGEYSIVVTATDGAAASVSDVFRLTVGLANPPREVSDANESTSENATLSASVPDAAQYGSTITRFNLESSVSSGTLIFNANGSYSFNPGNDFNDLAAGETRQVSFRYSATYGTATSLPGEITIVVTGTNDAPVASNSSRSTGENTVLSASVPAASDIDGSIASYSVYSGVSEGSLSFNSNGSYSFNPGSDFNDLTVGESRNVTFQYRSRDNAGAYSTPASVTITVTGTNDAPVASNSSSSTGENTILSASVPAASDIDGSIASYSVYSGVSEGSLSFNSNGTYSFNPGSDFNDLAAGESRNVTFSYRARDNAGAYSTPATVTITVTGTNDAPVASNSANTTGENTVLSASVPAASDIDGTIASYSVYSSVSEGSLSFNSNGTYSFSPGSDFDDLTAGESRNVSFQYHARDNAGAYSAPATVTITVTGTNDAPVASNSANTTGENTVLSVSVPAASDIDGSIASYSLYSGVSEGSLSFNSNGTYSFNPGADFNDLAEGESRNVTFSYRARDNAGAYSAPATVTITVTGTNDAPLANPANLATGENTLVEGILSGSDIDGSIASYNLVSGTNQGQIVLHSNGNYSFNPENDFDDLAPGENRSVSFVFNVTDNDGAISSNATVTIQVSGSNDLPVAAEISRTTTENSILNGVVSATDIDGTIASYSLVGSVSEGALSFNSDGSYSFDPGSDFDDLAPGQSRVASFSYTATDNDGGVSAPQTVTISVTGTNDAPFAANISTSTSEDDVLHGSLSATDVDGSISRYDLVETVQEGSLSLSTNGDFSFDPGSDFDDLNVGQQRYVDFTYTATDNLNAVSSAAMVSIRVTGTNDAPIAEIVRVSTTENAVYEGFVSASDPDGTIVGYQLVTTVTEGNLIFDETSGAYTFDPGSDFDDLNDGQIRAVSFTYVAIDNSGAQSSEVSVTIEVNGSNDIPRGFDQTIEVQEASSVSGTLTPAIDSDGSVISYRLLSDVSSGTLEFDGTGQFTYITAEHFNLHSGDVATTSFTYVPVDNNDAEGNPVTVTINIHGNEAYPLITSHTFSINENEIISGNIRPADTANIASYNINTDVAQGILTEDAAGNFSFNPGTDFDYLKEGEGVSAEFTYTSVDLNGIESDPMTVRIYVHGTNDSPVVFDQNIVTTEDLAISGYLTASDPDTEISTFGFMSAPDHGIAFFINPIEGSFTYDPSAGHNNLDYLAAGESLDVEFNFIAYDRGVNSSVSTEGTVTITVNGVNDRPWGTDVQYSVEENGSINAAGLAGIDIDGTISHFSLVSGVDEGELTFNADGSFSFEANSDFDDLQVGESRDVSFLYTVTDNDLSVSDPSVITITVTGVNDAPYASSQNFITSENGAFDDTVNAVDPEGDVISYYTLVSTTSEGSVNFNADGTFSFDPGTDFDDLTVGQSREVSFTYTATDDSGAVSDLATATVLVTGTNDAPFSPAPLNLNTDENTAISGQVATTDVDGEIVGYEWYSENTLSGVSFNADGSFTYDPGNSFDFLREGVPYNVGFHYLAVDNEGAKSFGLVNITVTGTNDLPSPRTVLRFVSQEGSVLSALLDADDPDSSAHTFSVVDDVTEGSLTLNSDGSFSFDLLNDFDDLGLNETRDVSFTYGITDETGATAGPYQLFIRVERDDTNALIMDIGGGDGFFFGRGNKDDFIIGGDGDDTLLGLSGNDRLEGGFGNDILAGSLGDDVLYDIGGEDIYTFSYGDGSDTIEDFNGTGLGRDRIRLSTSTLSDITLSENGNDLVLNLNNPDDPAQVNQITLLQAAVDSRYAIEDIELQDGTVVSVSSLIDIDYKPIAREASFSTGENTTLHRNVSATDVDGSVVSYALVSNTAQGSVSLDPSGNISFDPGTDFDDLAIGQSRTVSFTYSATDNDGMVSDPATVTVLVTGSNDAPIVETLLISAEENTVLTGTLSAIDPDGSIDHFELVSGPAEGSLTLESNGNYTFDPEDHFNDLAEGETQIVSFSYVAVDNLGATSNPGIAEITVIGTNDQPVPILRFVSVIQSTPTFQARLGIGDPDTASHEFSLNESVTEGSLVLDLDGLITFDPLNDFDDLTVNESREALFTYSITEDTGDTFGPFTIRLNVSKNEDNELITSYLGGDGRILGGGYADTIIGGSADNAIRGRGGDDYLFGGAGNDDLSGGTGNDVIVDTEGEEIYRFILGDGIDTIEDFNSTGLGRDLISFGSLTTVLEDISLSVSGDDIILNINNPDSPEQVNQITILHAAVDSRYAIEGLEFQDGTVVSISSLIDIDYKPIAQEASYSTEENTALSGSVSATDADGAVVSYELVENTTQGSVSLDSSGNFSFDPGTDFDDLTVDESRTVSFSYAATDDEGMVSDPASINILVTGTNDAPILENLSVSTEEHAVFAGTITATDLEGSIIRYELISQPTRGAVTLDEQGNFTFDPGPALFNYLAIGESEDISFTYTATDDEGLSSQGVATVTVTGTNDLAEPRIRLLSVLQKSPTLIASIQAYDPDGSNNVFTLIDDVSQGRLQLDADGYFSFDPLDDFDNLQANEFQEVFCSYTVTDEDGYASVPYQLMIRVERDESNALSMNIGGGDGLIIGNGEDDWIVGGSGDSRLVGRGGNDTIEGGLGNDSLFGSHGDDVLTDIGGEEIYSVGFYFGSDTVEDLNSTGLGRDRMVTNNAAITLENVSLETLGDDLVFTLTNPDDLEQVNQLTILNASIDSRYFIEDLYLTGQDSLIALDQILDHEGNFRPFSGLEDIFIGTETNDEYNTRDTIDGDIYISGLGGNDQLYGGNANSYVLGGEGNDTLYGGLGDGEYHGGLGNDVFYAGSGNDLFVGGAGNDIYEIDLNSEADSHVVIDNFASSLDFDLLRFNSGNDAENLSVGHNGLDLVFTHQITGNTLTVKDFFRGDSYQLDEVHLSDASVWTAADLRALAGFTYQEVIVFENPDQSSVNYVYAYNDNNFYINASEFEDSITSLGGNDFINAGAGNDYIEGGEGADIYYYELGDGSDVIGNYDEATDGSMQDILRFGSSLTIFDIEIEQRGNDLVITIVPTEDEITIMNHFLQTEGNFHFELSAYEFSDGRRIDAQGMRTMLAGGSDGDDFIEGFVQNDVIEGFGGNDTIWGYSGDDFLFGNEGNDSLYGGAGNDYLGGGTGDDYLEGGAGDDIYLYELGDGNDTIFNIEEGIDGTTRYDRLSFGGGITPSDVVVSREDNNLVFTITPTGERVTANLHFLTFEEGGRVAALANVSFEDGTHWNIEQIDNMANLVATPVTLDLDGDGLEYRSLVHFDIDNDGQLEATSWAGLGDGILALDRDSNGRISQGSEISFVDDLPGAATDLEGLVAFDSNGNMQLDSGDARFADFLVWQDFDLDGISSGNELSSLNDLGISSISLVPTAQNIQPIDGVILYNTASFTRDGQSAGVGDVGFQYSELSLGSTTSLENAMSAWASSGVRDLSSVQVVENEYDVFGNLERTVSYGSVASDGSGILNSSAEVSEFIYDNHGQLLQSIAVRGSSRTTVTDFSYDGAGRLLSSTGANGTTSTDYDGNTRQIRTTNEAGLVTSQNFDDRGKLMSTSADDGQQTRSTSYYYDRAGRLAMTRDAQGQQSWIFYDEAGRIRHTVDEAGAVTGFQYNSSGQLTHETRYATTISTSGWFGDTANWISGGSITLESITPMVDSSQDREMRYLYNDAGRLISTVEEVGVSDTSVNTQYDGAGRVISTDTNNLRRTRFFYDKDGLLVGTLIPEGYLSENVYDALGRLSKVIRYEIAVTGSVSDMASARDAADGGQELITYYYYDAQGRRVGTLNEQGYLSETIFEPQNNRTISRQYLTAVTTNADGLSLSQVRGHAGSYQSTTTNFDSFGRVSTVQSVDGTITRNEYDSSGRLVRVTSADGTSDERQARTRYNAFGEVSGMVAGVGASISDINSAIDQYGQEYFYNALGQRIREEGPEGQATYYYYDDANRLSYVLNAEGDATSTSYNAFGNISSTRQYVNQWNFASQGNLSGGEASDISSQMASLENSQDLRSTNTYDVTGQLTRVTDASGAYTSYAYNIFGERTLVTQSVGRSDGYSGPATLTTLYQYNSRGSQTLMRQDRPVGYEDLDVVTSYDAFNRVIGVTDANGNTTSTRYNNKGREVVVTDALDRQATQRFDAFGRVITSIDGEGNTSTTTYDDVSRLTTTQSSNGDVTRTWRNRQGEIIQSQDALSYASGGGYTTYRYTEDGKLEQSTDRLGDVTRHTYDRSGRLTSTTDQRSNTSYFTYDKANRLNSQYGSTVSKSFSYDGLGKQTGMTEGSGGDALVTEYQYDNTGRKILEILDPTGLALTTRYSYTQGGQIARIEQGSVGDEAQRVTVFEYDNAGRKVAEIVDPNGLHIETNYGYDNSGNLTRTIQTNGSITSYTWSVYNDANQVIRQTNRMGEVTSFDYDDNGRLVHTRQHANRLSSSQISSLMSQAVPASIPAPANSDDDRRSINVFDEKGREAFSLTATDANTWVATENIYDRNGNIIETRRFDRALSNAQAEGVLAAGADAADAQSQLRSLGYRFNNWGDSSETAYNTRRTRFVFDAENRLRFTISAENEITENTYDANGNVATQTQFATRLSLSNFSESAVNSALSAHRSNGQNRQLEFVYDAQNRLIHEYSPTTSLQGYANNSATTQSTLVGRLRKSFEYDSLGRIEHRTEGEVVSSSGSVNSSNARTTDFVYDKAGRQIQSTLSGWYDSVTGQVYRDQAGNSNRFQRTVDVTYDDLGNAVRNKIRIGHNEYAYQYKAYDAANRMVADVDALGYVTKYSYDDAGNLTSTIRRANSINTSAYRGDGQFLSANNSLLGSSYSSSNDRQVINSYNSIGQVTQTEQVYASNNFNSSATNTSSTARSSSTLSGEYTDRPTTEFQYNAFGEQVLKRTQRNNLNNSTRWADSYSYYDRIGRLTLSVDAGKYGTAKEYNALGDLVRSTEYANDFDGVLSVNSRPVFTESSSSDPSQDRIVGFTYDKMGRVEDTLRFNFEYQELVSGNYVNRSVSRTGAGQVIASNSYNAFGDLTHSTDALGNLTTSEYNTLSQITQIVEPTRGIGRNDTSSEFDLTPTISLQYDAFGNVVREAREISESNSQGVKDSLVTLTTFDHAGFQTRERKGWTDSNIETDIHFKNDLNGRVIEQSQAINVSYTDASNESFSNSHTIKTHYQYDLVGRHTTTLNEFDGRLSGQTTDFNGFGEVIRERKVWGAASNPSSLGTITVASHSYDRAGRRTFTRNDKGYHYYYYDLMNNVTRMETRESSSNYTTMRVTEAYYDALGRKTLERSPRFTASHFELADSARTETSGLQTPIVQQSYDRWGNVILNTAPASDLNGLATIFRYNHDGHVIHEEGPSSTMWNASGISFTGHTEHKLAYDIRGNLVEDRLEAWNGTSLAYSKASFSFYNNVGQLTETRDATDKSMFYTYDFVGNRVSTRSEMGIVNTYDHNLHGQVVSRAVLRGGTPVVLNRYLHDQAGRRYAEVDAAGNAVYSRYDARGKLLSVSNLDGGSTTYTYDDFGNKLTETEDLSYWGQRWEYEPPANNTYGGSGTWVSVPEFVNKSLMRAWTYAAGNYEGHRIATYRTTKADGSEGETQTYYYNGFKQLVEERSDVADRNVTYRYFENGLLQTKSENHNADDNVNSSYKYDIAGRKVKESNNSQIHVDMEAVQYGGNGTLGEWYSAVTSQDTYFQYDQLGRLAKVNAGSGYVNIGSHSTFNPNLRLMSYRYDEFGNRRAVDMSYTFKGNSEEDTMWYTYDKEGRMVIEDGYLSGGSIRVGKQGGRIHAYNNDGQRATTERWSGTILGTYGAPDQESYTQQRFEYNDLGLFELSESQERLRAFGATQTGAIQSTGSVYLNDRNVYDDRGFKTNHETRYETTSFQNNKAGKLLIMEKRHKTTGNLTDQSREYQYDYAGNLLSYRHSSYSGSSGQVTNFYYTYEAFMGKYQNSQIRVSSSVSGTAPGITSNAFDARGRLRASYVTEVEPSGSATGTSKYNFAYDAEDQIINRHYKAAGTPISNSKVQSYYYHGNGQLADIGDFGVNYTPNAGQWQGGSAPGSVTVSAHDSLTSVAQMVYGDASLWYVIAEANGMSMSPTATFGAEYDGKRLTIPSTTVNVRNDANSFKPYNAAEVIGDLTPDPAIIPPPAKECNRFAVFVMVVVAIIVSIVTFGLAVNALGPVVAGFISGVAGSVASQMVGKAMGAVEHFSLRQAVASGVAGAFSAGIGEAVGASSLSSGTYRAVGGAIRGAGSVAAQSFANKFVGLDSDFRWSNVIAAAAAGAINAQLGIQPDYDGMIPGLDKFGEGFAAGFAQSAIEGLITRAVARDSRDRKGYGDIILDAFGNGLAQGLVVGARPKRNQTTFEMEQSDAELVIRSMDVQKETGQTNRERNNALIEQAVESVQAESSGQDLVGQEQQQALQAQSQRQASNAADDLGINSDDIYIDSEALSSTRWDAYDFASGVDDAVNMISRPDPYEMSFDIEFEEGLVGSFFGAAEDSLVWAERRLSEGFNYLNRGFKAWGEGTAYDAQRLHNASKDLGWGTLLFNAAGQATLGALQGVAFVGDFLTSWDTKVATATALSNPAENIVFPAIYDFIENQDGFDRASSLGTFAIDLFSGKAVANVGLSGLRSTSKFDVSSNIRLAGAADRPVSLFDDNGFGFTFIKNDALGAPVRTAGDIKPMLRALGLDKELGFDLNKIRIDVVDDHPYPASYFTRSGGKMVFWEEIQHASGNYNITLRRDVLESDMDIVHTMAHELFELQDMKQEFIKGGGKLSSKRFNELALTGNDTPHTRAHDFGNDVLKDNFFKNMTDKGYKYPGLPSFIEALRAGKVQKGTHPSVY